MRGENQNKTTYITLQNKLLASPDLKQNAFSIFYLCLLH